MSSSSSDKSEWGEIAEALEKLPLPTYIGKGKIHAEGLNPENLQDELRFENLTDLIRVYFLVSPRADDEFSELEKFLQDLRYELRRIKTTTRREPTLLRGKVRGEIDWQRTYEARYSQGKDSQSYACQPPEVDYDTRENLVLKLLLQHLRETVELFEDLAIDDTIEAEKYEWFNAWLDEESNTRKNLDYALDENVYLSHRVSDINERDVTDRMIDHVRNSRKKLYRDAAKFLGRYRRLLSLQDIDDEEARKIISNVLVGPDDKPTLFELYWVFKTVETLSNLGENGETGDSKVTLNTITKQGNQLHEDHIATWENEGSEFRLFHDYNTYASSASDLLWGVKLDAFTSSDNYDYAELKNKLNVIFNEFEEEDFLGENGAFDFLQTFLGKKDFIQQGIQTNKDVQDAIEKLTGETSDSDPLEIWRGRPDLVLVKKSINEGEQDTDCSIEKILIGEVKYTRNERTVNNGIRELFEYINYLQISDNMSDARYVRESDEIEVRGVLCVDKLPNSYQTDSNVDFPRQVEVDNNGDGEGPLWIDIVQFESMDDEDDENTDDEDGPLKKSLDWIIED